MPEVAPGAAGLRRGVPARPVRPARGLRQRVHPAASARASAPTVRSRQGLRARGRPHATRMWTPSSTTSSTRWRPARRPSRSARPCSRTTPSPEPRGDRSRASSTYGRGAGRSFIADRGLAMDLADIKFCQSYFATSEKRDPTITEIARDRHLLVGPLPPHHLRHRTSSDVQIDDNGGRRPRI